LKGVYGSCFKRFRGSYLEPDVPHLLLKEARASLAVAPDFAPQIAALAELHYDPYFCCLFVDDPAQREHGYAAAAAAGQQRGTAHLS
jgi:hypothetical protein